MHLITGKTRDPTGCSWWYYFGNRSWRIYERRFI